MADSARNWQVTRNCCVSGYCMECHQRGTLGRPARIVHATNLTKDLADRMVVGWREYKPLVSQMPDGD